MSHQHCEYYQEMKVHIKQSLPTLYINSQRETVDLKDATKKLKKTENENEFLYYTGTRRSQDKTESSSAQVNM